MMPKRNSQKCIILVWIPSMDVRWPKWAFTYSFFSHAIRKLSNVQVVSDVYINNGVWDYADQMAQLNHTVYLYNFEYMNPRGFGLLGYVMPFKGQSSQVHEMPRDDFQEQHMHQNYPTFSIKEFCQISIQMRMI